MLLSPAKKPIKTADVLRLLKDIADQKQEHFIVLTFDGGMRLINKRLVFLGTVSSTVCHPREVFAGAVADFASGIIVSHNHPSGDPTPSTADITTNEQLVAAGHLLGIRLYDHIIVAGNRHYSFLANGMILPPMFDGEAEL